MTSTLVHLVICFRTRPCSAVFPHSAVFSHSSWNVFLMARSSQPARSSRPTRSSRKPRTERRVRTRRTLRLQVLDDRRVLAAITGAVYEDANDSMRQDSTEIGLVGRLVYVDQNDNGRIDATEPYSLTGQDGGFSIEGIADGDHSVRVFNGARSQVQTTPTFAVHLHDVLSQEDITAALPAVVHDAGLVTERTSPAVFAIGSTLQTIAADGTVGTPVDLGSDIISLDRVTEGGLIVFTDSDTVHRAFLVNDSLESIIPFTDSNLGPELNSGGVDDVANGVVVGELLETVAELYSVSDQSLTATSVNVPLDTVVTADSSPRTTDGPTRSILSSASQFNELAAVATPGLAISVWSNASASLLTTPILVGGGLEVVAFSDEAGLLVVRGEDDLTVHDIDNNLATLYTIADTGAGVDIDAARGLVVVTSPRATAPEDAGLRILDQETGSELANLVIDLSAVGDVATVALDAKLESVVVAGTTGLAQVNLRRPDAHRVTVTAGANPAAIEFGIRVVGENTAPNYANSPTLQSLEDTTLVRPAPLLLSGVIDAEGDGFVMLPGEAPDIGAAEISVDGGIQFVPPANFEGSVDVPVILTDGHDLIETIVTINVVGVPDAPTGIGPIAAVPENILIDGIVDVINVIDADLVNDHVIEIDDVRFEVINGELIFVGPGRLDFETEWTIPLILTVNDADAGSSEAYAATITVEDADDPVTDILLGNSTVLENRPGDTIGSLDIEDEDFEDIHSVTVDDDRFVYDLFAGELRLADGVSLDREASETIVVNVTASFKEDSFTKEFTLTVLDTPETPTGFLLTNANVLENLPAAVVGDLTIAGNPATNGHSLTVNDSRFIFDGSTLRLADGVMVQRTPGVDTEIQVEVTATPTLGGSPASETFIIQVLENELDFHNADFPEDVDGSGEVSALDALIIINYLNDFGTGPIGEGDPDRGYDVNGDGEVSPLDALLVINELNAQGGGTGSVGNEPNGENIPEGEPMPSPDSLPGLAPPVSPGQRSFADDGEPLEEVGGRIGSLSSKIVSPSLGDTADEIANAQINGDASDGESTIENTDEVFAAEDLDLLS